MEISKSVFLETIDNSPKFRTKFIEEQIELEELLSKEICKTYNLNLINEIYYLGILRETYNSKKRNLLKDQEIIFIRKMIVYKKYLTLVIDFIDNKKEIDYEFKTQFKTHFQNQLDREVYEKISKHVIDTYLIKK